MTQDSGLSEKTKFEIALKGKRYGGALYNWAIREIYDVEKNELLGSIAYGYLNGHRSWRTSKVVKVSEYDGKQYVETQNSYYLLFGDQASDEVRNVLYNTIYG